MLFCTINRTAGGVEGTMASQSLRSLGAIGGVAIYLQVIVDTVADRATAGDIELFPRGLSINVSRDDATGFDIVNGG
jgi:hypothetical protein